MSVNQNDQKGDTSQMTLDILGQLFDEQAMKNVNFRLWDGTVWPDDSSRPTTIVLNHPGALRRILRNTQSYLSVGEAYVYDDFDIIGDIYTVFPLAEHLLRQKWGLVKRMNPGLKLLQLPEGRKIAEDVRQAAGVKGQRHSLDVIVRQLLTITMSPTISTLFSLTGTWFIPVPILSGMTKT